MGKLCQSFGPVLQERPMSALSARFAMAGSRALSDLSVLSALPQFYRVGELEACQVGLWLIRMKLCCIACAVAASRFTSLSGAFACDSKKASSSRLATAPPGIFFAPQFWPFAHGGAPGHQRLKSPLPPSSWHAGPAGCRRQLPATRRPAPARQTRASICGWSGWRCPN